MSISSIRSSAARRHDGEAGSSPSGTSTAAPEPSPRDTMLGPFVAAVLMWPKLVAMLTRADRRRLRQAMVATVVASAATAMIPVFVGAFVDAVYPDGDVVGLGSALAPLALLLLAYGVINVMDIVRHQKVHTVTTGAEAETRRGIYAHLFRLPLGYLQGSTDGAVYGRANRGVEGAVRLLKLGSSDLLPAVLVAVFGVVVAMVRYGALGLLLAVVIPTGFALVAWQIESQDGVRVSLKESKERIDGWVTSSMSMVKEIRTSGTEEFFDARVGVEVEALRSKELKHHVAMSMFDSAKALNELVWLIVAVLVAIQFELAASAGDLAGVILLYAAITKPLRELHRVVDESAEAALQAGDLLEDLARPIDPSYDVAPAIARSGTAPESTTLPGPLPVISVRDVRFAFGTGAEKAPVLNGISLDIAARERVGLVGASGCGKSTLLDLLERLHPGYQGTITLHGRDLETISRAELTRLVGYVGQRPSLFAGSVRDNLVMGRPGITDGDLQHACRKANVLAEVAALGGFDAVVAQRGENLSGGQQQRLCIARALLATPPVMLLDEPTSALDAASQSVVQQAIDALDDVTMVVVAHRLSTLRAMDRILVLRDGVVVEEGPYDALAAAGGPFAAMLACEQVGD